MGPARLRGRVRRVDCAVWGCPALGSGPRSYARKYCSARNRRGRGGGLGSEAAEGERDEAVGRCAGCRSCLVGDAGDAEDEVLGGEVGAWGAATLWRGR